MTVTSTDLVEIPQDIIEMNLEILDLLKEDEVDLSKTYSIEHHFSSTNFSQLEKLAVDLFQAGFDVLDPDEIVEEGVKLFCFDALINSKISEELIIEQQKKIYADLRKYHVNYDGWGVDINTPLD